MTTISSRAQSPGSLGEPRASRPGPGGLAPGSNTRAAWAGFCVIAAVALVFLLWEGRGDTFFYDEWSWIQALRSGLHSILGSYNQHLEVVPLGTYQLLFHTVGISSYWPYRLLAAIAHLAVAAAIFAFALRRIGNLALLIVIPVAFFGAGWEFILWGVNFGFTASIAFSIAALIWLERGDSRGAGVACGLLTVGLLFSETALLFAAGVAIELTWRDRSLRRMWVWAIPAVVYAVWWLAYYQPYLSEHDFGAIPGFTAQLAAGAAGGMFGAGTTIGWAVLAAVVATLAIRIARRQALTPRLAGLAVTALLFWALVAFGRAELGDPSASKYVYTGAVLLLLLLIESLRGLPAGRTTVLVVAVLAAVSLVGNVRAFSSGRSWLNTGSRTAAAELGALQLARATAPAALVLDPQWAPQIIAGSYFAAVEDLGSTPAVPITRLAGQPGTIRVSVDNLLRRAGDIAVTPAAAREALSSVPPVVSSAFGAAVSRRGGCVQMAAGSSGMVSDLVVPASGVELMVVSAGGRSRTGPTLVMLKRFASVYAPPAAATLKGTGAILLKPVTDADAEPWQIRIISPQIVHACTLAGA